MKEIEIKVLKINKEEIENKLANLGAKIVKNEIQTNIIFDSDQRILKSKYNGYLRIRITKCLLNGTIKKTITLKKNISKDGYRNNIEHETEIANEDEVSEIFQSLGYSILHKGIKTRKSFQLNDILFEFDTWDKNTYPETYMEIEVNNEEKIEEALALLKINKKNVSTKSIEELRKEYINDKSQREN